jgi:3-methyladenine DNA glycosylase/8-oxoguanine DNA glycosylase
VIELRITEITGGVEVAHTNSLTPGELDETSRKVSWMLNLDQDYSSFYSRAREEPKLSRAAENAQGRILRSPTLFEDVIKTILTTNTSWAGTRRMVQSLVAQYGAPLPMDTKRRAFPTPEALAASSVEALRAEARLGYRAPYVLGLAQAVAAGTTDLESLKTNDLPTPELRKRLLAIKGVGSYAVANLLALLGRYDYLPIDSWAVKMVSQEWYGGAAIGSSEVEAAFESWKEWKALSYWFWDWSPAS